MLKLKFTVALPAIAMMLASGAAQATTKYSAADAKIMMTYTTAAQISTSKTSGYSGVGGLFVSYASTAIDGFGSLCTGSLINAKTVVTAAHCIFDYEGGVYNPVTSIRFILPSFGERNQPYATSIMASDWEYHSGFETASHEMDLGSGNDIALFSLSEYAGGFDTYDFFDGDPLQQYIEVGNGTIGGPNGTGTGGVPNDYLKRTGNNVYELYGDELFSDVTGGVLLSDFDDYTDEHDVFGRWLGIGDTGVAGEASSSPGDSGGPSFINGKIAAITSWGLTGAIFDGWCGPGLNPDTGEPNTDPAFSGNDCTNSSVGEINGNTWVGWSENKAFISAYLAAHPVPEPATWLQMIAGLSLLGGAMRVRARKVNFA